MEHDYIHEQQTVHLVIYHILWCPKRRRKVQFVTAWKRSSEKLLMSMDGKSLNWLFNRIMSICSFGVIRIPLPTDIARWIKGRSSHVLREEFPHLMRMPSLWTRSTFYSTAGNVSSDSIQKYIEKQSTE